MNCVKSVISVIPLILIGCSNPDRVNDKTLEDKIARELLCIASSERFMLYDEAQKHLKHLQDARSHYWDVNGKELDLKVRVLLAREHISIIPKEYAAQLLMEECKTKVPKLSYESIR
ncbi:hypothetical protein DFP77_107165 [Marinomonas foliarum]|uniref:Lipoprotein n=1 Tax=Marinomonas foliarum TaxID=491950 RepID=A0A369AD64_9GAMM|nr:hypothetical protein DFP77_107165 [Marinomonas foliarum]